MEIIPLIPERDVVTQHTRVAQNRDVRTQAKACLLLGRYYKEKGELDKAEALYQRALVKARPLQAHGIEADACSGLGLMYSNPNVGMGRACGVPKFVHCESPVFGLLCPASLSSRNLRGCLKTPFG